MTSTPTTAHPDAASGTASSPESPRSDAPRARTLKSTQVGVVASDKRDKTRTVVVDFQIRHPKYGKYLKRQTRYQVHDPGNQSKLGDRVEIANCRPISKTKSWRLIRVVEAAPTPVEHRTEV